MSAVSIDQRTRERYELDGINSELNAWGRWIEKHMDYEGYPGITTVEAWLMGRGGGTGGHRILCLDMPTPIYATHGRVLRLTEYEQEAIWVWYVVRVKPDGTLWPIEHKCKTAGITEAALRQRVSRARRKIAGLPVD